MHKRTEGGYFLEMPNAMASHTKFLYIFLSLTSQCHLFMGPNLPCRSRYRCPLLIWDPFLPPLKSHEPNNTKAEFKIILTFLKLERDSCLFNVRFCQSQREFCFSGNGVDPNAG